jgi:hypothetical protein
VMLDKGKLVPKRVAIHGANGHEYYAIRWVNPNDENEVHHTEYGHSNLQVKVDKLLGMNAKGVHGGRDKKWQETMSKELGLKLIGGGSNKAVFEYGDKVLKVASHPNGMTDFRNEYNTYHTASDKVKSHLMPIHEMGNGWGVYDKAEHTLEESDTDLIPRIERVANLFRKEGYNVNDLDVENHSKNMENWGIYNRKLVALDYADMGEPEKKSLYIDLEKAFQGGGSMHRLNTAKLVRRMVMVRGKNGKVFRRMQWVKPWEASTGHGVRAIHNDKDLNDAREDGLHKHPDFHNALKHQGVFNAEHMANSYSHEHPLFIPETEQSRGVASLLSARNHIPHGATEYNRHDHLNGIHYSHDSSKDETAATAEPKVIPDKWMDMTASQLAQHGVDLGMDDEDFLGKLRQAMDRDAGDIDHDMLAQVAEEMYYISAGSRPSAPSTPEPVKLPDTCHLMTSGELTSYARHNYSGRYSDYVSALELAKRERSGGVLSDYDDIMLDNVRDNLGLAPDNTEDFEDQQPFNFDNLPTMSNSDPSNTRQRVMNGSPSDIMGMFGEENSRSAKKRLLASVMDFHGENNDYSDVINQMADKLGLSAKDIKDMANDDLHDKERKVRRMARGRMPSEAKPKSKAISEQTQPLDINQIRRDNPGPSVNDFYEDKVMKLLNRDRDVMNDLLGGISVAALEHIFSHPDGESYKTEMTSIDVNGNRVNMALRLTDKDDNRIGHCDRYMERRKDGTYHVHNSLLTLEDGAKGKGVATHFYHRAEQLWKHLAGEGNRVEVSVFANISVGTYAWADKDKGFDFDSKYERDTKRNELREFIKLNGWNEDEVMKSCGYTSVDDLHHAWQFASLDDGFTYDIGAHGFADLSGKAGLGKAFMLTHAASWSGMKYINDDGSVNRQKHIDKLVNEHQNSMGNWFDGDDDLDDDDDEHDTSNERETNGKPEWFNQLSSIELGWARDELNGTPLSDLDDEGWSTLRSQLDMRRDNEDVDLEDYSNFRER